MIERLGRHQQALFVSLGPAGQPPVVIVFQYNPEVLTRSFVSQAGAPPPTQEIMSFTLALDAIDLGAEIDPIGQVLGIMPTLTALEELMENSQGSAPPTTFLFWGPYRLLPVQLMELVIRETEFNEALAPVRAQADVVLRVLGDIPEGASEPARQVWREHQAARKSMPSAQPAPIPDYLKRLLK
jgi:hypothetical protein